MQRNFCAIFGPIRFKYSKFAGVILVKFLYYFLLLTGPNFRSKNVGHRTQFYFYLIVFAISGFYFIFSS